MTFVSSRSGRTGVLRLVWRVLVWTLLLVVLTALVAAVLLPRMAGATPYTVLTGSMQPDYPPGTLVVVRPVDIEDVAVGDVVTYQLEPGQPAVVTHRVVSVGTSLDGLGERMLRTQGDANDVRDEDPVRGVQLKGRLWYAVPHLGRVGTWFSGPARQDLPLVLAIALAAYAVCMLGSALVDRRRRPAS